MLNITGLYASLLALLIIILAINVVKFRRTKKVGIGDNGDNSGIRAIRTHANSVEYIPTFLILMAIYEINSGNSTLLHGLGAIVVIGRVIHAFGLNKSAGVTFGRFYGTLITWISIIVLSVLNIINFVTSL